ncbi:hypothetical protein [Streptomyces roseochromogenus]|uniref:Uncharacterized protein n=1 Tax=Streptomyces roseochromogenus subsp. oscitans DS 12.976 TaxID=1352936 RepID=V6KSI3_STRRC|nr:hypothetical protein [Streptomyces roseochromogenus]EST35092.1 hypothetical protein M878_07630 [Streptomyces roseochromogenus subsp. oscitans DS 12.976]
MPAMPPAAARRALAASGIAAALAVALAACGVRQHEEGPQEQMPSGSSVGSVDSGQFPV